MYAIYSDYECDTEKVDPVIGCGIAGNFNNSIIFATPMGH